MVGTQNPWHEGEDEGLAESPWNRGGWKDGTQGVCEGNGQYQEPLACAMHWAIEVTKYDPLVGTA